jgi:acetyl-CoA acetyltransferase
MVEAYICDATRTAIGRFGGALSHVRADDLGAIPIKALMARNPGVDWAAVQEVSWARPTNLARITATRRAWPPCSLAFRRKCRV